MTGGMPGEPRTSVGRLPPPPLPDAELPVPHPASTRAAAAAALVAATRRRERNRVAMSPALSLQELVLQESMRTASGSRAALDPASASCMTARQT